MPRTTKRTIRKYPTLARDLLRAANDADLLSRKLKRLAAKVADREYDATTLQDVLECEALNGMLADAAREVTEAWRRPAKVKKVQP